MKFFASLFIIGGLLSSCGSDSTTPATTTSEVTTGLTLVNSKLNAAASVLNANAAFQVTPARSIVPFSTKLDDVWTTDPGVPGLYDGTQYSLKQWFTDEFNPNFVNASSGAKVTFAGRIANSMNVICVLGRTITTIDSTNLPIAGTYPITITTAVATACGDAGMAGQSVTITVTNTTDTTLYDRNFSVDMGNACPFLFKLRMNSTAINAATAEDQMCDGRDYGSASVILYNRTTDVMRFTYFSQGFGASLPSGFEFYRGYYNGAADESYIFGYYGGDTGAAAPGAFGNYVSFTSVGKPTAGGTVALSIKTDGGTIADDVYNGCVNTSTNAVESTTDTLACTMTGVAILGVFNGIISTSHNNTSNRGEIYNIDETTTVGFTDNTDMF